MNRQTCRALVSLPVFGLVLGACMPAQQGTDTPVQEPEPVDANGIPWAPGEAPDDHASTTRDVADGPKEQEERPDDYYKDDGITQAPSGSSTCSGRPTPALRAAINVRANETHACYDKVPPAQAGAKGDLKLSVKVKQNGEVAEVKLLADSLKVSEVTSCVMGVLEQPFTDTRPKGGCAVFVIPIHLESEEVEPATQD